jgi:hypothetical protein
MKIFWIFAVTLSSLQGVEAQAPTGTHSEAWKLYSYAYEGFEIRSPEIPLQTSEAKDYRQYRIYWNEQTNDVINVSFSLKPVDCTAWTEQVRGFKENLGRVHTIG